MNTSDPDKESHLIEAIVFTTDFLSCAKKPIKGSLWTCGSSSSTETIEEDERSCYNDDGSFGLKRRQLISYKNAEDLKLQLDAMFHRKRSPLSPGAAAEVRDDLVENEECSQQSDNSDHHFFSNLQRRIDDATSTCPSTNPSLSQEELNHWYSSSWSSFTYYGSAKETYSTPTKVQASNSKHHRSHRSITKHPAQKDLYSRQWIDGEISDIFKESTSGNQSSSYSMPDFLKGVEFKSTGHHHRVISLPPSLPSTSISENYEMVYPVRTLEQSQEKVKSKIVDSRDLALKKKKESGGIRYRRLGRKTRECWNKAKRLFNRREGERLVGQ
eukprot:CAMPEP_0116137866 /NCGR_PEP_ID=MMETSP0329-20121206/12469_1 /TAXON_ID=697910 /ORGANISM="Pseudo-nitzschia arenysensis, Strain B593" /LENGTH=327 /DNA_ID=CAMNT_0003632795 /DNA_START=139 /DNA_END=1122 /DNA_ORIENTATION=+